MSESEYLSTKYDVILSVGNFGAKSLKSAKGLASRLRRQIHMVAHDRPLESYLSMRPSFIERGKMTIQRRVERRVELLLSGVGSVCVSKFIADRMVALGIEESKNIVVVPNGVDVESFRPLKAAKRFDLLFVGRFQLAKGLDVLLSALPLVRDRDGTHPSLGIIGEFNDAQRAYLNSVMHHSIRERVAFLGKIERSEMPRFLNSTRFLVAPSRYESFGLPALEAISCGIPVIASKVGGLPEIIDEDTGMLVEPRRPSVLAASIEKALGQESLHERALKNGPARARSYDWDLLAKRMIESSIP
jgi:glycosyltransferase involved in cell wall biosynthesis